MKGTLNRSQENQLRGAMRQGAEPPHVNLFSKRGGGGGNAFSQPKYWQRIFGGLAVPSIEYVLRTRATGPNRTPAKY